MCGVKRALYQTGQCIKCQYCHPFNMSRLSKDRMQPYSEIDRRQLIFISEVGKYMVHHLSEVESLHISVSVRPAVISDATNVILCAMKHVIHQRERHDLLIHHITCYNLTQMNHVKSSKTSCVIMTTPRIA